MNTRCKKCGARVELSVYSRGDPEKLSAGENGEAPYLKYECVEEECNYYTVSRKHVKK